jgi:hypothetical protein
MHKKADQCQLKSELEKASNSNSPLKTPSIQPLERNEKTIHIIFFRPSVTTECS